MNCIGRRERKIIPKKTICLSCVAWQSGFKNSSSLFCSAEEKQKLTEVKPNTLIQKKSSQNTKNLIMSYDHQQPAFLEILNIMLWCFNKLFL